MNEPEELMPEEPVCACCNGVAGECDCVFHSTHERGSMPRAYCAFHGKTVWEGEP